jgi:putative Mn2+ efflux pump MntP
MSLIKIFLLSLALAADAFSVGAAVGLSHTAPRQVFRLTWHFGLFQSLFAGMGVIAGSVFVRYIESWDHWVAFGLLLFIGGKMIVESLRGDKEEKDTRDATKGMSLMGLSTAVSIDAFGAGLVLATVHAPLAFSIICIGVTSLAATLVSMKLAGAIATRAGKWLEPAAGAVLILLGLKILFDGLGISFF